MRWVQKLRMRFRMLVFRNQEAQRLDAELEFHIEQQTAENIAAGMLPEEARRAAIRAFGNPLLLREQARESWSRHSMENFIRDIRYSLRALARAPGFSLTVIVVMALGIGATVAMFTVVYAVLMKPLPFQNQGRLVRIYDADAHDPTQNHTAVSGLDYSDWRQQNHSFAQMAIAYNSNSYNLSGGVGQLPEQVKALTASWNIFRMLGVSPALGRYFGPATTGPEQMRLSS